MNMVLLKKYFPALYEIIKSKRERSAPDTAVTLAEGLSIANNLAQVRAAAKNALGGDEE